MAANLLFFSDAFPELDKYQSLESSGISLPSPPKLDAADDRAPMVREKTDYDPCKASKDMCLNKGKCTNRDGEFICSCPPTHFGKRCERMADTRFCRDHKCQNGGTCLSITKNQTFVDPIALRQFKKANPELSASETKQDFLITVQYQCICLDGFIGEFCHITEEERSCEEDYCSSHGRGHYDPDTGCVCECDPQQWVGERVSATPLIKRVPEIPFYNLWRSGMSYETLLDRKPAWICSKPAAYLTIFKNSMFQGSCRGCAISHYPKPIIQSPN
ncbi:unnamed protein product [Haemonchus placei]|uniref:EGF-like domain-containing protein n=1 Tax=Haemonchus placei TaxID=6290 RepID=A0A3P7ZQD6_HAEPC|nr:unnamed protein product [Haemonchus placei]